MSPTDSLGHFQRSSSADDELSSVYDGLKLQEEIQLIGIPSAISSLGHTVPNSASASYSHLPYSSASGSIMASHPSNAGWPMSMNAYEPSTMNSSSIDSNPLSALPTSKSKKPKRDPHAPKFYISAFQLFWKDQSGYLSALNRQKPLSLMERNIIVKKLYDELPPEKRQAYKTSANADRERYLQEFEMYKHTHYYREYQNYLVDFYRMHKVGSDTQSISNASSVQHSISNVSSVQHSSSQAPNKKRCVSNNKNGGGSGSGNGAGPGAGSLAEPKALTAFFLFSNEMRPVVEQQVLVEGGDSKLMTQTKILTEMWRDLPEQQKEKYREMYRRRRDEIAARKASMQVTSHSVMSTPSIMMPSNPQMMMSNISPLNSCYFTPRHQDALYSSTPQMDLMLPGHQLTREKLGNPKDHLQ